MKTYLEDIGWRVSTNAAEIVLVRRRMLEETVAHLFLCIEPDESHKEYKP
jgi:hypothetical protein